MKIESLAPSAQPDGPLVCTLEIGERLKVPTFLAADFNLYAGRELSEDELSALRAAIARARTRQRAVRILSSTAISRAALEKRLTDKGAVPEDAQDTVQWLDELHLLDDAAVAEQVMFSSHDSCPFAMASITSSSVITFVTEAIGRCSRAFCSNSTDPLP